MTEAGNPSHDGAGCERAAGETVDKPDGRRGIFDAGGLVVAGAGGAFALAARERCGYMDGSQT